MDFIEEKFICCIKNCHEIAEYNYKFFFIPQYCEKHKKSNMKNIFNICRVCQKKYKKYEH